MFWFLSCLQVSHGSIHTHKAYVCYFLDSMDPNCTTLQRHLNLELQPDAFLKGFLKLWASPANPSYGTSLLVTAGTEAKRGLDTATYQAIFDGYRDPPFKEANSYSTTVLQYLAVLQ
ncbi:hypothetical protein PoMZ_00331 [Pyricularia oryzae]|uniref:Uncharacterized protein n=1 Tax=Pyricularia oryzae TaxID=318829 RepID=A0A4P7N5Y4_PYROR|nr:hypothetical protein PoMZ_00331 [Pyricularia oryzae]